MSNLLGVENELSRFDTIGFSGNSGTSYYAPRLTTGILIVKEKGRKNRVNT